MDWQKIYLDTDYTVDDKGLSLCIKVGQPQPLLDKCLSRHTAESWGFITAWNPYSQSLPEMENKARNRALAAVLAALDLYVYRGKGGSGDWWEDSFLVFPIARNELLELGRKFEQNAVLYGERGGVAELLWCEKVCPNPLGKESGHGK